MENKAQQDLSPIQPTPQTPIPSISSTNWSKILLFTVLGLILVTGLVFIGIQIGKKQVPSQQPLLEQPTASPTKTELNPTEKPTMERQTKIPNNWTVTNGSKCNIKFATPPFEANSENRQWMVESDSTYNFLGFFKGSSDRLIHRNQEEASGFISGMVSVICGLNTSSTTTEKLFSDFHDFLGLEAARATVPESVIELTSAKDIALWGEKVKEFTFVGGMFDPNQKYYLFTTNTNWYLVTKKSDSALEKINNQTDQIFSLLEFAN